MGHRTVPVEVGSNYLAHSWGQKMMTFREFFDLAFGCSPSQASRRTGCESYPATLSENPPLAGVAKGCNQCPIDTTPASRKPDTKRQRTFTCTPSERGIAESAGNQPDGCEAAECDDASKADQLHGTAGSKRLYLAQHSLFDQVPGLRKDIMVCRRLKSA